MAIFILYYNLCWMSCNNLEQSTLLKYSLKINFDKFFICVFGSIHLKARSKLGPVLKNGKIQFVNILFQRWISAFDWIHFLYTPAKFLYFSWNLFLIADESAKKCNFEIFEQFLEIAFLSIHFKVWKSFFFQ